MTRRMRYNKIKEVRKRTKKGNTAGVTKSKSSSNGTVESAANSQGSQNVLCISRNKHWKYISSYHVRILSNSYEGALKLIFCVNVGTMVAAPARAPRDSAASQPQSRDSLK